MHIEMERFGGNIIEKIERTLYLMEEEWNEMNLPEHQRHNRRLVVFNGLCNVCDTALASERAIKERIINRIEDNKAKLFSLCQELSVTFEVPESLLMLDLDFALDEKLTELTEIRDVRLLNLRTLIEKDKNLCSYLGEIPYHILEDKVPSENDIDRLKIHIQEMEKEKVNRIGTYKNLRKDILSFAEILKKTIEGEILLDVVCNEVQEDALTKSYMLEIRKLHSDLEFDVKEMESYSLELREKISLLWTLLQIPLAKQDTFLASVSNHDASSIEKLESHLAELKELRLQNLGKFIKDLKSELQKWWERCFVGDLQKKSFHHFDSDDITEQILEAYENEVKKWKCFYEENIVVFEKVEQLLGLFDMMQQLEEKAKDPSRLFNTRGGALLQEEKERKRVRQELPLVEEQLLALCQKYDACHDAPFLIDGETAIEYLSKLWDYHNLLREKDKMDRQNRTKAVATPKGAPKGPAVRNTPTIIVTPAGSRKRGREGSMEDLSAKRVAKIPSGSHFQSPLKEQRTPRNAELLKRSLRKNKALQERNHLLPPPPPSRRNPLSTDEILQSPLTYDTFKAALSRVDSQEIVHSSVLCSDSGSSIKNETFTKNGPRQIDRGRQSRLKTTLNLESPRKLRRDTRNKFISGGASGGAYLVRSISQPSVMRSTMSPAKKSQNHKLNIWKP